MTHSLRSLSASALESPLLISVRVQPRSSSDGVTREGDGRRVHITAPPVDGAANEALVDLLARRLGLRKRAVLMARGASSRNKVVAVQGLTSDEFWLRHAL